MDTKQLLKVRQLQMYGTSDEEICKIVGLSSDDLQALYKRDYEEEEDGTTAARQGH